MHIYAEYYHDIIAQPTLLDLSEQLYSVDSHRPETLKNIKMEVEAFPEK